MSAITYDGRLIRWHHVKILRVLWELDVCDWHEVGTAGQFAFLLHEDFHSLGWPPRKEILVQIAELHLAQLFP